MRLLNTLRAPLPSLSPAFVTTSGAKSRESLMPFRRAAAVTAKGLARASRRRLPDPTAATATATAAVDFRATFGDARSHSTAGISTSSSRSADLVAEHVATASAAEEARATPEPTSRSSADWKASFLGAPSGHSSSAERRTGSGMHAGRQGWGVGDNPAFPARTGLGHSSDFGTQSHPAAAAPPVHPWAAARMKRESRRKGPNQRRSPPDFGRRRGPFMKRLARAGLRWDSDEAERTLKEALTHPGMVDAVMCNAALNTFAHDGRWQVVLEVMQYMRESGIPPDAVTYTNAIKACGRAGEWQRSVALLREMPANGVEPNPIHYVCAMTACREAERGAEAVGLLREMPSAGIEPNVICYNTAIAACGTDGDSEVALDLLHQMQAVGVRPNAQTYLAAIRAAGDRDRGEQAASILSAMDESGISGEAKCYALAIEACGRGRQWVRALEILREMEVKGVEPLVMGYNACIVACGDGKQWEQAVALLREMPAAGISPTAVSF